MNSGWWFILLITVIPLVLLIYHVGNPIKFFKTKQGAGAGVGIAVVISVLAIIILLGGCTSQGRFGTGAYVFGGIDYTKKISPLCAPGVNNDHGTSNVGFGVTIWETNDRRTSVVSQYTHHSCFVGSDLRSYDAIGISAKRDLWTR